MNEKQVEARLAEIREQQEWRQQHADRFRIGALHAACADIDYLLSLLQQPATSERCGECGHSKGVDVRGRCFETQRDPGGSMVYCGCKCVYSATGAAVDLVARIRTRADEIENAGNDSGNKKDGEFIKGGVSALRVLADEIEDGSFTVATTGAGEGAERADVWKIVFDVVSEHAYYGSRELVKQLETARGRDGYGPQGEPPATVTERESPYYAHIKTCTSCGARGLCSEGAQLYNAPAPVQPVAAPDIDGLYGVGGQVYTFIHQLRNDLNYAPHLVQRAQELLDAIVAHDKEVERIAREVTAECKVELSTPTAAPVVEAAQDMPTKGNTMANDFDMAAGIAKKKLDERLGQNYRDAVQIARHLAAAHFAHVPEWEPLPTLSGVLSQISNMVTAWNKPSTPGEAARESAECLIEDICGVPFDCPSIDAELVSAVRKHKARGILEITTTHLSHHFPPTEATQRKYFCSCGAACTTEEYIEHYFEQGHDRGEGAQVTVEADSAENWRRRFWQLRAELSAAQNEISTGFDVIFPYVVEANDADGAPLSLADKIEILGSTNDALNASLSSARANAIRECRDAVSSAIRPVGSALEHHYRRAFNEGVAVAVNALESLAKEGDDAKSSS